MSFNPRPCTHCGGTSFHVIPHVGFDIYVAPNVMGADWARIKQQRPVWFVTLVGCAQCGRTETFSSEIAKLAGMFPTAQTVTSN